jgi:hypothetical protein
MRTTLDIADEVLRLARKRAADERMTLRELVETALRSYLSGRPGRSGYRLRWRSEKGRLRPGVNLDDRQALWDLMEGRK